MGSERNAVVNWERVVEQRIGEFVGVLFGVRLETKWPPQYSRNPFELKGEAGMPTALAPGARS